MLQQKIRRGVFETNSSSCHSISIASGGEVVDKLFVDDDGVCHVFSGEFGWDHIRYKDPEVKAAYALTHAVGPWEHYGDNKPDPRLALENNANIAMLRRVIQQHTGAAEVVFDPSDDSFYPWGYIDHQSIGVCSEAFKDEESLRQFIFNPNSWLETDNDNREGWADDYFAPERDELEYNG